MFFLILLGLFLIAIAFFHYLQGFFSATLSAIFTVVAAVVAVSYHESVVEGLLGGKMADYAHAMVLLALFGVVYLVLRILSDNLIPGDVRVPAGINKAGAAIMGLIAGVFATGIMAIAAQELPFGPSIAGYSRYDLQEDRAVVVVGIGKQLDRQEYGELTASRPGSFGDDPHGVPILPVDSVVVGAVEKVSDGSLSSGKPFHTLHPDFLGELFGQRVGIEAGGNHVAMNLPDKKQNAMDVEGLYHWNPKPGLKPEQYEKDSEFVKLRTGGALKPVTLTANQMYLVVRVIFKLQAADQKDRLFRFSPGSARLVLNTRNPNTGELAFTDLYPIGTLQDATTLYLNKPDDFMFVSVNEADHGADLVYVVDKKQFEAKAPAGTFVEVKRLARVDLSGMEVKPGPKPDATYNVMRKTAILAPPPPPDEPPPPQPETPPAPAPAPTPDQPAPAPGTPPTPAPAPAANAFQVQTAVATNALPVAVTAPGGSDGTLVQVPGGTAIVAGGNLKMANLDSTPAEQVQPVKVTQFAVPEGQTMVQVRGAPAAAAPWAVAAEPDQYEVVDSGGKKYQPYGVFAVFPSNGAQRFYLRYVDSSTISGASPPDGAGAPSQIVLLYLVPPGTTLTEFDDHGQKAHDLNVATK